MYRMGIMALALVSAAVADAHHREPLRISTAFGPFTIKVEIEGVTQGVFQSVEGLASESEVLPGEEYGEPALVPGPSKGARLVLRRPYDPTLSGLWNWRQSVLAGSPWKRDGHIFIFAADGGLAAHWVFHQGWPSRWEVPKLTAGVSDAAEEVVEIVHAGLTLEPPAGP